jgi:hypothetical protein
MLFPSRFSFFSSLGWLFTGIIFLLTGCDSPQETRSKVMNYYDLKGFIETQISTLNREKPEVTKIMKVSGKEETRSSKDVDWKKELELFSQADINKPAYSKSYIVEKPDSATVIYTLKKEETLPVRYVKIMLDKKSGNPISIQALLRAENKLYQSEKDISLSGLIQNNRWVLQSYSIRGYQKLATMDKKLFNVSARVNY